jgi:hypothetical protein
MCLIQCNDSVAMHGHAKARWCLIVVEAQAGTLMCFFLALRLYSIPMLTTHLAGVLLLPP